MLKIYLYLCFSLVCFSNLYCLLLYIIICIGYVLITNMNFRAKPFDQKLFDDQNTQMLSIRTPYGGFCYNAPHIPLIGNKTKEVSLPFGTHRLIFYSYFTYFNIDITVHVRNAECFGLINICASCMRLYKPGNSISIDVHI